MAANLGKVTTLLDGVPQFIRAVELTESGMRDRTKGVIQRHTKRVAANTAQRAPRVTGEMASTIRDEYSSDGMIGYVKVGFGKLPRRSRASTAERRQRLARKRKAAGTKAGKGSYAPVVEFGDKRRHHKPHPFIIPALMADRSELSTDLKTAAVTSAKAAGLGE